MASPVAPTPEAPASTNSFGRIFGALFSPKETFASIAARPTWLAPLIVLCVLSVSVIAVFSQRVGWHDFMVRQIESNSRTAQMSAEQKSQIVAQQEKFAPIGAYGGAVIGTFLAAVVIAAIFMGVFNVVGGTKVGFKTSLGIVSYGWAPGIVSGLLGILILFLKDPSTVDLQNLVASNPAALLSDGSAKWLVSLLGSLDIFSFWMMILMALGYSATNPKKLSFGKAFGSILAVWLIYVVVKVGLAAAFS
jgi:hypothetical protein